MIITKVIDQEGRICGHAELTIDVFGHCDQTTPFEPVEHKPAVVRIKMRQHAGQSATPAVEAGRKVKKGQVVGRVESGKLGANVHASIDGKVRTVTPDYIEIVA